MIEFVFASKSCELPYDLTYDIVSQLIKTFKEWRLIFQKYPIVLVL